MNQAIREHLKRRERLAALVDGHVETICEVSSVIAARLLEGHTLYACGNGGSASQAEHLVAELIGRFKAERQPLPAVALYGGWGRVHLSRQRLRARRPLSPASVRALCAPETSSSALSTSGQSPNVVAALQAARELGRESLALLGRDGGRCRSLATWEIVIDETETALIQEAHLIVIHLICECIDALVRGRGAK